MNLGLNLQNERDKENCLQLRLLLVHVNLGLNLQSHPVIFSFASEKDNGLYNLTVFQFTEKTDILPDDGHAVA
jgi:hypothetical protein